MLNATFNNISVILVEEIWVDGENNRLATSESQTYRYIECTLPILAVIVTDCVCRCTFNYHTIETENKKDEQHGYNTAIVHVIHKHEQLTFRPWSVWKCQISGYCQQKAYEITIDSYYMFITCQNYNIYCILTV